VGLGAGAVLSLIGVAAVAVVMGLQAREESARAVAARDFMLNIFQRADQEKSRGADITARDLLETGRKDVLTRLAGQPKLQAELLRGIAKIQDSMGEYVTADSTYAELVRVYSALHQPREEAMARADHAFNALQMNNPPLADRMLKDAEAVPGRPLADPELNARLAEVGGQIALSGGDTERARELFVSGRQAAIQTLGVEHLRTFMLGQALFRAERERGDIDAALALQDELRRSVSQVRGLDSGEVASMDWEHVNLLFGSGRFAQALSLLDAVLPRCVNELGAQEQRCRLLFLKNGQTLLRLGKVEEAVLAIPRLQAMSLDSTLPFIQIEALLLEFRLRSLVPAQPELLPLFQRVQVFGESGADVTMNPAFKATALLALAESRLYADDPAQARHWADLALALMGGGAKKGGGLRISAIGRTLSGVALLRQGQPEQALELMQSAQADFAKALGSEHPTSQLFALNMAPALVELGRVPEAVSLVKHAEPILRSALGVEAPTYREVLGLLRQLENRSVSAPPVDTIPSRVRRSLENPLTGRRFFS
jgi:eukaryotic-like serine/threonine-protein kinase